MYTRNAAVADIGFLVASVAGIVAVLLLAQSCVSSYDVRHVRWGMTRDQVMRAEAANKPEVVSPEKQDEPYLVERDVVAGIASKISFSFTKNRLDSMSIGLDIDESKIPSGREIVESVGAVDRATHNWNEVLQKRYGKGSIVFDSPEVPRVRPGLPYELSEPIDMLQHTRQMSSFEVDFENSRTRVQLSCFKAPTGDTRELISLGAYDVTIFFLARPQDTL